MRTHRDTLTAIRPVLMAALLSLGTYNSAVPQELEATAQVGQATVGVPSVVVLNEIPQIRTQDADILLERPETGLTDAQYDALKAQAAKFPDPNGRSPEEGVLSPSSSEPEAPSRRRHLGPL